MDVMAYVRNRFDRTFHAPYGAVAVAWAEACGIDLAQAQRDGDPDDDDDHAGTRRLMAQRWGALERR